jgi:VWFA-related protein
MRFSIFALLPALAAISFSLPMQVRKPEDQKPKPVFSVTTRLVQASVIVQDKNGRPVTGLKKDDFVLRVGRKEREISVFSEETTAARPPAEMLPPGVYSNELARQPGIPNSLTAVLFDTLNTKWADQLMSKKNVAEFLSQIQPQDRVAIFVLGRKLRVLHDFSNDSASLVRAIQEFKGRLNTEVDASKAESYETGNPVLDGIFERSNEEMAQYFEAEARLITLDALTGIADYFASFPGRKNVLWVAGHFSFDYRTRVVEYLNVCRALSNANVSLYPVDARGLVGPNDIFGWSAANRGSAFNPNALLNASSGFAGSLQNMDILANWTGGRAFYNTNDITHSLRQALEDSTAYYMLGFYPRESEWNSTFHNLEVKVNRPGVEVRHRAGFYALPEPRLTVDDHAALALKAVKSPLEATRLTLTVRLAAPPVGNALLRVELILDPLQIKLESHDGRRTGSLYLAIQQATAVGRILQTKQEKVNLNLAEATYQSALRNGFSLNREWSLEPGVERLRIGICDGASDSTGSIVVPVSAKAAITGLK